MCKAATKRRRGKKGKKEERETDSQNRRIHFYEPPSSPGPFHQQKREEKNYGRTSSLELDVQTKRKEKKKKKGGQSASRTQGSGFAGVPLIAQSFGGIQQEEGRRKRI